MDQVPEEYDSPSYPMEVGNPMDYWDNYTF